jgi:hypothetical protein
MPPHGLSDAVWAGALDGAAVVASVAGAEACGKTRNAGDDIDFARGGSLERVLAAWIERSAEPRGEAKVERFSKPRLERSPEPPVEPRGELLLQALLDPRLYSFLYRGRRTY